MKICIAGQDSLAAATRECCARHFELVPYPCHGADIFWVCYDTPICSDDRPDGDWVIDRIREQLVDLECRPLILVSSQMPVGTTAKLEQEFPEHHFAYQPENIRVASAVADFKNQARVVVGVRTTEHHTLLHELFAPFTKNLIVTSPETAEFVKHALNAFLATNIVFSNEIARLCEKVGADAQAIYRALISEPRISPKAPLRPGAPYGGGHLARDVYVLNEIASKYGVSIPVISNIKRSNEL